MSFGSQSRAPCAAFIFRIFVELFAYKALCILRHNVYFYLSTNLSANMKGMFNKLLSVDLSSETFSDDPLSERGLDRLPRWKSVRC